MKRRSTSVDSAIQQAAAFVIETRRAYGLHEPRHGKRPVRVREVERTLRRKVAEVMRELVAVQRGMAA